jgi:hypothetical protein
MTETDPVSKSFVFEYLEFWMMDKSRNPAIINLSLLTT